METTTARRPTKVTATAAATTQRQHLPLRVKVIKATCKLKIVKKKWIY
jgi:hypothetical protein